MELKEIKEQFNLADDVTQQLEKLIQSETDKVRTDYSQKLKTANAEIEKYKPKEKTSAELELEQLKSELAKTKFEKSLTDMGVDNGLFKYLKNDIDMTEFSDYYKGLNKSKQDYKPKNHIENCGVTKEQFRKMSIEEKTKLYSENPELYAQLKK